jgi:hypothetical protein
VSCEGGPKKDGFTVPTPAFLRDSLAQKLVPAVDKIRDIYTQLGARPYRVRILRTRSSGPRRGVGVEQVIHELELLPTPLVVDMQSLSEMLSPVGRYEQGVVQLQYVSGRYTEEILLGVGPNGGQVAPNETVYYEIEFFRRDGSPSEKRRFVVDAVPYYNALKFQWFVNLVAASERRARDGSPEG